MKGSKPAVYSTEFFIKVNEPIMPATVVSKLLGIPVWTLKRIDKEGIVSPPRKKDKMRLYSKGELNKLRHIWHLINDKNVKITGLKVVLDIEERSLGKG
jgi:DNA-binding transcriptional MerR regulator